MLNTNYTPEIIMAQKFIKQHSNDIEFVHFLDKIDAPMRHSDRWSFIYDWLTEHYGSADGKIVTGLAYMVES